MEKDVIISKVRETIVELDNARASMTEILDNLQDDIVEVEGDD